MAILFFSRANWSQFSTCTILQQMVDDTKLEAYQRGICAQIYGTNVSQSINSRTTLLQKISKKVFLYHDLCSIDLFSIL